MGRLIRFDWAAKKLLRSKANFGILEGFLSELLKEDIKIKSVLESESNKDKTRNKSNRVDLLVEDSKGEMIIIEIQNTTADDYLQRILFGASKLIVEHIDAGKDYSNIKRVISVSIVYFDLGEGEDYIYKGTTRFIGIYKQDELQLNERLKKLVVREKISDLYPSYYIIKVNQFNDIAKNTLDEWIYFLKNEQIKPGFRAKGLSEAKEKLDIMKLNDREREQYEEYEEDLRYQASMFSTAITNSRNYGRMLGKEEGIKEGIEKGIKQGIEKGIKQGIEEGRSNERFEMAKKLLNQGLSAEMVAMVTGLDKEEIEKML